MIYVDMDGVLVRQIGRLRFDLMGWMPDGRLLWSFVRPLAPTILSQLRPDIYEISAPEKRIWCARELGPDVPVIVVRALAGKHPHAAPGDVLIDDDEAMHAAGWRAKGGIFIAHRSAQQSIKALQGVLHGLRG